MGKVLQQVQLAMLDHAADIGVELPKLSDLREMLDQQLDWQPALHFELAEQAGLGFFEHALRQVGRDNLDSPAGQRLAGFLQKHCDRVGFLAGRGGRRPDA